MFLESRIAGGTICMKHCCVRAQHWIVTQSAAEFRKHTGFAAGSVLVSEESLASCKRRPHTRWASYIICELSHSLFMPVEECLSRLSIWKSLLRIEDGDDNASHCGYLVFLETCRFCSPQYVSNGIQILHTSLDLTIVALLYLDGRLG